MHDEYDEYNGYAGQRPGRFRRRMSWRLACLLAALIGFLVYRVGTGMKRPHRASQEARFQSVSIVDWKAVDASIKRSLENAYSKAQRHAEVETEAWIKELQTRVDEDFLPWWFGYFNQQAVMLRAAGYWCLDTPLLEGLVGRQESMQERLGRLVEREFHARVLQPRSAQLRVEKITRKTMEVYLLELQEELDRVQVEFQVNPQDWGKYLGGLPATVLTLEANRQVGLVVKGLGAGGGAAAFRIARAIADRVRALMVRRVNREFIEHGAMMGGRYAARGAGWWIAVACAGWDLADHHVVVRQNLPVLRRALAVYLEELEEQVLGDQRCGILAVLGEVQREVLEEIGKGVEP